MDVEYVYGYNDKEKMCDQFNMELGQFMLPVGVKGMDASKLSK